MISIGIIVFREVLEVSIILGILLLATSKIEGRNKWVWRGLVGGVVGSLALAYFTEYITGAFEGSGQEILNACILISAGALIAWTIVWMNRHGRHLAEKMRRTGGEIKKGIKPVHTLGIISGLAVLREGSEIVLFTYGFLISGHSVSNALWGALFGFIAGAALGVVIYFGFIRVSQKIVFKVTNIILTLLSAGMISRGFSFLSSAGILPSLGTAVWDLSETLPDRHWLGVLLSATIGYTSQPSGIQVLVYILSLAVISGFLFKSRGMFRKVMPVVISGLFFMQTYPLEAYKLYSPSFTHREVEIEARMKSYDEKSQPLGGGQNYKLGVGVGLFPFWFSEIYGEFEKNAAALRGESIEWENRFMFFEPGQNFFDTGLYLAYEYKFAGSSKAEIKLLFQKETGRFVHILNPVLELPFDSPQITPEVKLGFGSRYRLNRAVEPGFEIYGDFGTFDRAVSHAGPALYGKVFHFKYDIAYLFFLSAGPKNNTFKVNLEYEIYF